MTKVDEPMPDKELEDLFDEFKIDLMHIWIDDGYNDREKLSNNRSEEAKQKLQSLLKQAELRGRVDEMLKMPTRAIDDPEDDTNVFWYRTYTMPEYEKRITELKSQMEKEG